jgi:hypothetical protein
VVIDLLELANVACKTEECQQKNLLR